MKIDTSCKLQGSRLKAQGSKLKKDSSYFHASLCADRRMRVYYEKFIYEDIRKQAISIEFESIILEHSLLKTRKDRFARSDK